jgi:hypothetical protein
MADHDRVPPNRLREGLLAQNVPPHAAYQRYSTEIENMLAKQEQSLKRQKWYAGSFWIYAVLLGTAFLVFAGNRADVPPILIGVLTSFLILISAAVELLKYFINRSQTETLRAIKSLEAALLELKEQISLR